jgi:hypothetical protein
MRTIFLNCWFGEAGNPLYDFFKKQSGETDIFVLYEVSPTMHQDLFKIFTNFSGEYVKNTPRSGQSIFVKNDIQILDNKQVHLFKQLPGDTGCLQKMKLKKGNLKFVVGGVHGKAAPGSKKDTKLRLNQSKTILDSFDPKKEPTIIGGDFNLMPQTQSIKMFEQAGYINLIKEFGITSTRNHFSWEQAKEIEEKGGRKYFGIQTFADYAFVSPGVKVQKFEVPDIEISDHLPLILDFEV